MLTKCYQVRSGGCPLIRGTEPSVYINGLLKKIQNSKGGDAYNGDI